MGQDAYVEKDVECQIMYSRCTQDPPHLRPAIIVDHRCNTRLNRCRHNILVLVPLESRDRLSGGCRFPSPDHLVLRPASKDEDQRKGRDECETKRDGEVCVYFRLHAFDKLGGDEGGDCRAEAVDRVHEEHFGCSRGEAGGERVDLSVLRVNNPGRSVAIVTLRTTQTGNGRRMVLT